MWKYLSIWWKQNDITKSIKVNVLTPLSHNQDSHHAQLHHELTSPASGPMIKNEAEMRDFPLNALVQQAMKLRMHKCLGEIDTQRKWYKHRKGRQPTCSWPLLSSSSTAAKHQPTILLPSTPATNVQPERINAIAFKNRRMANAPMPGKSNIAALFLSQFRELKAYPEPQTQMSLNILPPNSNLPILAGAWTVQHHYTLEQWQRITSLQLGAHVGRTLLTDPRMLSKSQLFFFSFFLWHSLRKAICNGAMFTEDTS